jgi:hypothetical protein
MNGLRTRSYGGHNDCTHFEITFGWGWRANANYPIGHFGWQTLAIGFGCGQNRFDSQILTRSDDPHGNLASVGNEEARYSFHADEALGKSFSSVIFSTRKRV